MRPMECTARKLLALAAACALTLAATIPTGKPRKAAPVTASQDALALARLREMAATAGRLARENRTGEARAALAELQVVLETFLASPRPRLAWSLSRPADELAGSLDELGVTLWRSGQSSHARTLFEDAIAIRKRTAGQRETGRTCGLPGSVRSTGPLLLDTFVRQVQELLLQGRYPEATSLARSLDIARSLEMTGEAIEVAGTLRHLAGDLLALGAHDTARALCEHALWLQERLRGARDPGMAPCLATWASTLSSSGSEAAAVEVARTALDLSERSCGAASRQTAHIRLVFARALTSRDTLESARQTQAAWDAMKKSPDVPAEEWMQVLLQTARLSQLRKQAPLARQLYEQVIALGGELQPTLLDPRGPAPGIAFSSSVATGATTSAELLRRAGGAGSPDGGRTASVAVLSRLAAAHHGLGIVLNDLGDSFAARRALTRSIALFEKMSPDHPGLIGPLINLGRFISWGEGDRRQSEELLQRQLDLATKCYGEASPKLIHHIISQAGEASKGHPPRARRAVIERAVSRIDRLIEKSPAYKDSSYPFLLSGLAKASSDLGDWPAARAGYQRAREVSERMFSFPWYSAPAYLVVDEIRECLKHGEAERAAGLIDRLLESWEKRGTDLGHLWWIAGVVEQLVAAGDRSQARRLAAAGLRFTRQYAEVLLPGQSDHERIRFVQDMRLHCRDAYLTVHDQPSDITKTYDVVLTTKGLAWSYLLASQAASRLSTDPATRRVMADLSACTRDIARAALTSSTAETAAARTLRLEELTARKEGLQRQLTRLAPRLRTTRALPTFEQVVAALPPGRALVDYVAYYPASRKGPSWLAFVSVPGARAPIRLELGTDREMRRLRDDWTRLLDARAPGKVVEASGRALARACWDPVAAVLGGCREIVVSPDHHLWRLPLAALPATTRGRFLAEDFTFSYVTRAGDLVPEAKDSVAKTGQGLLCVGSVDYDSDGRARSGARKPAVAEGVSIATTGPQAAPVSPRFLALPATAAEIQTVRSLFLRIQPDGPGVPVELLQGSECRRSSLRGALIGKRYVHIATHGAWREGGTGETPLEGYREMLRRNPMLSTELALSGANRGRDGLLTGEEALDLPLSGVELVTLSACESGLGAVSVGEGLLGLKRAVLAAGAAQALTSAWSVGDEVTHRLMARFYTHLWSSRLSCSEALARAQRDLIASDRRRETAAGPRGWGAFTVTVRSW